MVDLRPKRRKGVLFRSLLTIGDDTSVNRPVFQRDRTPCELVAVGNLAAQLPPNRGSARESMLTSAFMPSGDIGPCYPGTLEVKTSAHRRTWNVVANECHSVST